MVCLEVRLKIRATHDTDSFLKKQMDSIQGSNIVLSL